MMSMCLSYNEFEVALVVLDPFHAFLFSSVLRCRHETKRQKGQLRR